MKDKNKGKVSRVIIVTAWQKEMAEKIFVWAKFISKKLVDAILLEITLVP